MTYHALDLISASRERVIRDPLSAACLTIPQETVFLCSDHFAAHVDGNQMGKSYGAAYLVHRFARNETPHMPRRYPTRPARIIVLGESYEQMVPLMEKLWALAAHGDLDPRNGFEPGRGITGKPPRLVFVAGPAKGAEVHFATYRAGVKRLQGGTYDLVVCDEPPPAELIGEVMPRLLRLNGYLRIYFTPRPDMYPQDYLLDYFERGTVRRFTFGLTEANLWPRGWPAPFLSQSAIDAFEASLLPQHRDMRVRGSLDPVITGRYVPDYDDVAHVVDVAEVRGWYLSLAVDHAAVRPTRACIVAIDGRSTPRPRVTALAEHVGDRASTIEEDAHAILRMIAAAGLRYEHIDTFFGDVPASTDDLSVVKANDALRAEIARITRRPARPIVVPHKGRGSVELESRAVNAIARTGGLRVVRSCRVTRRALLEFDGDKMHRLKDSYDAFRYAATQPLSGDVVPGWISRYG